MTRMFASLGAKLAVFFIQVFDMYRYLVQCIREVRHLYLYRHQVIEQFYAVGVGSLPLVCLISAFSGMAVAIQMAYQMEAYVPDYMVGSIVVRSVVLVLSPILIGLVLAGRVGAGIASELGTMKVSEQVDALTSMAVDPVGYLMLPRILAGLVMVPILIIFSSFISISAGFIMSVVKMHITVDDFIKGMKLDFMIYDIFVGLVKSTVYGGVLTFVGSYMGLQTVGGAQGVGQSATSAVVVSSALILILDYFLTLALLY
ncbi:MAG: phospholipid/cholesterol/gamma-HCH transport system permease protein [Candidatus Latescibacterota bacterium]|jgi:phospholipid/cholesterol/gamma-HCH transport system permease protein